MCINYCFQHTECWSAERHGHNTNTYLSRCWKSKGSNIACPHTKDEVVIIPWFISLCDACFAPTDNKLPDFRIAVDLDREELRAPAKLYLTSFLDHISRHGPESRFALNRETMSNLQPQYIEEVQTICSALEIKIRWDAQQGRNNHTLAEKQLVLDLRFAIQDAVLDVITSLPAHTTSTPYAIFHTLTPEHRNIIFTQMMRQRCRHAGYDEWGRELVSPLCNCPELTWDEVERLQIVHEEGRSRFFATCGICYGKMIFLQRQDETRHSDLDSKPWWLLMLQGVSAIGPVTTAGHAQPSGLVRRTTTKVQRNGSKVVRAASTRAVKAGSSLLRTLTGKSIKEKR